MKSQGARIYCLQETYSLANDEKVWSSEWDGQIIYSHGTAHSRGAYILLNPNSTYHFLTIESDPQGRFVIAKIKVEVGYFFIVNIYAPNDYREQDNFIKTLSEYIISKIDTSRVFVLFFFVCVCCFLDEKHLFPIGTLNQAEKLVGDLERERLTEERASTQYRTTPRL